jgi:amidase
MTELWRLNASDIAARVARREISACEVTEQSLQRLRDVNPAINAVVQELPEQAMAAARSVDAALAAGEPAGLLAGVPVTIQVNIDQQGCANTEPIRRRFRCAGLRATHCTVIP